MKLFCFHKWNKWSDPFESYLSSYKVGQARRCEKCGKVQVSYVKSPWNWWFNVRTLVEKLKGYP